MGWNQGRTWDFAGGDAHFWLTYPPPPRYFSNVALHWSSELRALKLRSAGEGGGCTCILCISPWARPWLVPYLGEKNTGVALRSTKALLTSKP
jgi:hypothetical protein